MVKNRGTRVVHVESGRVIASRGDQRLGCLAVHSCALNWMSERVRRPLEPVRCRDTVMNVLERRSPSPEFRAYGFYSEDAPDEKMLHRTRRRGPGHRLGRWPGERPTGRPPTAADLWLRDPADALRFGAS